MKWNHFRIEERKFDSNRTVVWIDVHGRTVNVFDESVWDEFISVIDHLEDAGILFILFRSSKSKGFFAGADLRRIASIQSDAEIQQFMLAGQQALLRLEQSKIHTIALIHGPCLGGGLEFALACNERWALNGSNVTLGMPEAKLGLAPGWGGTYRLPRQLGVIRSLNMMIDNEQMDEIPSLETGLVDRVVDEKDALQWSDYSPPESRVRELDFLADRLLMEKWNAERGSLTKAQLAIRNAVESGLKDGKYAAMRLERIQFYELLSCPEVQARLANYRKAN